jgi:hypothetical protein
MYKFIARILLVIKEITDSVDRNRPKEASHCSAGQQPPVFMELVLFLCWQKPDK